MITLLIGWALSAPLVEPVGPCDRLATGGPIVVERERIGPYPTSASLADLRAICPTALPTLGAGFETLWAALDLGIGDVTIQAGQNWLNKAAFDDPGTPDPTPEWERAASHWVVRGCGARLASGVSTCATWSELSSAYGTEGEGIAPFGQVVVRLAALPGLDFLLDATDEDAGGIDAHGDLSRIPATARIEQITVVAP